MNNGTMMQYFEWYLPADKLLWKRCAAQAGNLKKVGITAVWLPPAYKGADGIYDVGYAVYDTYDLGEFNQKGDIATKYGTREEYLMAIDAFHNEGIQVLADIVLNHRIGADECEETEAIQSRETDRNEQIGEKSVITAWTRFTFPGRNGKYSDFTWNWRYFDGTDWDNKSNSGGIYRFHDKGWDSEVDPENGNYDYLMGADVDMTNREVVEELKRWGKWYLETANMDGFRLDAVKHIRFEFFDEWLSYLRDTTGKELFSVGEYWSADVETLEHYFKVCNWSMSLFDVPLHFKFHQASCEGQAFDMGSLLENTLVAAFPDKAVTFVDNHDTQPGQSLESWVQEWFKPQAYAVILLRESGYPCIFYGDYYAMPHDNLPAVIGLEMLLRVRSLYAYGQQHDYFDDANIVGWTREGDVEHPDSGIGVLLSNGPEGEKRMYIGVVFAGQSFRDCTRHFSEPVVIDAEGYGIFKVSLAALSVWVNERAYGVLVINLP
ncbi:alpha-amylase [Eubacterium callanderi]|uniref:Alpha-amylase n=1 Tax=Eubacterium callanderi TaxID=53442 RepID=A0A853JV92_9FIRM|nr:alpha-amylase [Eubacterium callanderi]MBO1702359.1 alpha-amylase [Eubacterium callanderi]MDR4074965.1 alpha-amylase [Eubacterium sp.]NZA39890.1 alpha-amylase [Eubacterium callanderi]